MRDSIFTNRHGERHEISREVYQVERETEEKCPEDIRAEQLYQHDKLPGEHCPLSLEMHCISEGGRKTESSFGHHRGNSFMHTDSVLLKFQNKNKRNQIKHGF